MGVSCGTKLEISGVQCLECLAKNLALSQISFFFYVGRGELAFDLCHYLINVYFPHQNVNLMREGETLPGFAPYTWKSVKHGAGT